MNLSKFFKAFPCAFKGVLSGFKERNMKFHGVAALFAAIAGLVVGLTSWEWLVLVVMIALVWAAELINTSVEELADLIRDELGLEYQATTRARDTAAGAVLVLAIAAVIVGVLIFLPKF